VDTNILRKDHSDVPALADEMVETHYAALECAACPFCYDGWVFLGIEAEDENGEHVEVHRARALPPLPAREPLA
jgi:hypothetical protein